MEPGSSGGEPPDTEQDRDSRRTVTGSPPTRAPSHSPATAERLLIVEDDANALGFYVEVLEQAGYEVITADSGPAAEVVLRTSAIDVVVTDLRMPKLDGLDILRIAKGAAPETVVILVTGFPAVETAVEAMKSGAVDYLVKPFSSHQLLAAVQGPIEKRRTKESFGLLRRQLRDSFTLGGLVGRSKAMLKLFDNIRKAAAGAANVLILGESGSGKELVARAVHENSSRRGKHFVPLNCAAIPDELLEAELFGYERGAFTGAHVSREGLLETANGGTLFLDEVCELSTHLQAKLLRALEESAVRHLGGRRPVPLDVRFMAATNRNVHEELRGQRFREDLFFRLNVIEIHVPSLRERREDIPLMVPHFLDACSAHSGKRLEGITPGALELLINHDWPGNVRELKNALERAVAYAEGPFIAPADFPESVTEGDEHQGPKPFHEWKEKTLDRLEREFLASSLEEHGENVTRTAKALGIHRSTLQRLMKRYNLPAA